jgi:hypothetical protein
LINQRDCRFFVFFSSEQVKFTERVQLDQIPIPEMPTENVGKYISNIYLPYNIIFTEQEGFEMAKRHLAK